MYFLTKGLLTVLNSSFVVELFSLVDESCFSDLVVTLEFFLIILG